MVQFLPSVIIAFVFFLQAIYGEMKKYNCELFKNVSAEDVKKRFDWDMQYLHTNACLFEGLNLSLSEKHFQPVTHMPVNEINAVSIQNSEMAVLTDDICGTLPFIKVFSATYLRLTSVDENAFQNCSNLEIVILSSNFLTSIPPKIFNWNLRLTTVHLDNNELTNIDKDLFENNKKLNDLGLSLNHFRSIPQNIFFFPSELKRFRLSANQLSDLSFLDAMPMLESLTEIYLDDNKLSDVDVENFHKRFPNLKKFHLNSNEFFCDRQTVIVKYLKENNISYVSEDETLSEKDCIANLNVWMTKKHHRQTQVELLEDINRVFASQSDISDLKSEIASLTQKLDLLMKSTEKQRNGTKDDDQNTGADYEEIGESGEKYGTP